MTTISSQLNSTTLFYKTDGAVKEMRDIINGLDDKDVMSPSMMLMYEEWKQKILLSDGIDSDENYDW